MTDTSAASGFFRSMPRRHQRELEVPILTCPTCKKMRPMTIKSIVPRLRPSGGVEVTYRCASCGASERQTVKPD